MTDALRQRAELHLLQLIDRERSRRARPEDPPWRRGSGDVRDPGGGTPQARQSFAYALEALVELAALPDEETSIWAGRFDSAEERQPNLPSPDTAPDPETERRARKLLDGRLPLADLDKDSQAYRDAVWRFEDALIAVRITGALSAAEQRAHSGRLDERLSSAELKKRHAPWLCKGVELLRVLAGPPSSYQGVTITHLELYVDGLILHWHRAMPYPKPAGRELSPEQHRDALRRAAPDPEAAFRFELEDDLGTSYRWTPGPSSTIADSKDVLVYWASATFTPAVPEGAGRLLARNEESEFEIALTG